MDKETVVYIYTMEYYSAIKNNNIMAFANKWMELENIMLSEISQSQKTKGQMFSLISGKWCIMGCGEWEKNRGTLDYVEGNEREGGMKNGGMRQTSLLYVHVWLHKWYESISCTTRETKRCTMNLCTMNQNAVCKNKNETFLIHEIKKWKKI